jgi:O-antigen/teichoic acid export membrane protein
MSPERHKSSVETGRLTGNVASEAVPDVTLNPEPFGAMQARIRDLWRRGRSGKAMRAGIWSVSGYGASTALRFISRLALAKLVSQATPMGDVAIIVVILAGLEMISDLGIGFNIVQHKDGDDRAFLGTAFSVQAIRGVGIWAIASLLAAPVGWIYHDPALVGLLLFGAVSTLAKSFANPGIWVLNRRVDLRGPTILTVTSEALGFLVTIGWLVIAPSAWAIVGGTVATSVVYAVGSHLLGVRAWFAWDQRVAREIVHFGGWMILSSATYFLSSRGESLMLRGAIPDLQFGCFAFASMLVMTPITAITQLASQVAFPTLASSVRDGPQAALRQFRRSKWIFTGIAISCAWGGMVLGPPIVHLMRLNPTFVGLQWMVQLLGLRAAMDIYAAPTGNALFASGASRYSAFANLVRLIILVIGLYFTTPRWGLSGAIWVLIGAPLLSYVTLLPGMKRLMPGALRVEAATGLIFLGALASAVTFFTLRGGM